VDRAEVALDNDESCAAVHLSVVVPVYGCAGCVDELYRRLTLVLPKITDSYEIILVDDRAPDDSWPILRRLASQDPAVVALRLSRNFGQHAAITAGLAESRGDWIAVMDCDLQDPPEDIPRLYEAAAGVFDIVYARRIDKQHSAGRRLAASLYFRMLRSVGSKVDDGEYGTFSLLSRPVVDAFLSLGDRDRHYLFVLRWLGFRATSIDYAHGERFAGRSAYSLRRLVSHALQGLFFQSTRLLEWIIHAGFVVAGAGALLAAYYVYQYFVHDVPPGFTSLAILVLLVGGVIIVSVGVVGMYVGRVFEQVKERPLYVIAERARQMNAALAYRPQPARGDPDMGRRNG
jgi:dolichol-phosphate mannosyltransferase